VNLDRSPPGVNDRRPIRVLIADDDPLVRELLSGVVGEDDRYELVAVVGRADAAIQEAEREQPDVALIDVRMPGGGTSAARGVRRRSPSTRVVALSAHDDRTTVLEMLQAGAVGYVVKGGPIDEITESIERAAAGRGSLSGAVAGEVIDELVHQLDARRREERRRQQLAARVRRAIDDRRVLSVAFQPICALEPVAAVGVEALSRFAGSNQRGPETWFAEAAEVGLGAELELLAIARALKYLPDLDDGLYLTLNASPATLHKPALERLLRASDPRRVVLEITERAPIDDYDALNEALTRLRAIGVRVAIDDAGAGFASLRHILRLSPEFIKLDRTLIAGIERDRSQRALAAGLISFADRSGSTIIAEGIERARQLQALASLGVVYGQGFFLAPPAPLAEQVALCRARP
jgi:EAL domain-containing protein (putative c-di-GMP-specific phosphodiesterase class I)/DNA-binding NarL/FixJ family response regulator